MRRIRIDRKGEKKSTENSLLCERIEQLKKENDELRKEKEKTEKIHRILDQFWIYNRLHKKVSEIVENGVYRTDRVSLSYRVVLHIGKELMDRYNDTDFRDFLKRTSMNMTINAEQQDTRYTSPIVTYNMDDDGYRVIFRVTGEVDTPEDQS